MGLVRTPHQQLGDRGEKIVATQCSCPKCKKARTLRKLPTNFRCADIICDFCGYLAQVKTTRAQFADDIPKTIRGAAWRPQSERMDAGIYFPLFLVLMCPRGKAAIHYLSADLQQPSMFVRRRPLKETARRAGWTGFSYSLEKVRKSFVRLA